MGSPEIPTADSTPRRALRLGAAFPEVFDAARANAPWAYQRLFDAFGPLVAGYLRGQGAEDPDSMANDVFLRAFTNLATFHGDEGHFRSWLFTIAHHRLVDDRRRRSRRPDVVDRPIPDQRATTDTTEAVIGQRLGDERVASLLSRLSPDQRDVLVLRIVGDLTVEEVAVAVRKRPGAVKALQRRGLAALRRILEAEDGGAEQDS
ncbi:RNA polymerase sigma factor [Rhabdothermincola salaria]|uniref:RNA polymerase sigma factor n=1 Tax=Rhabdothermincola salaria TaxID=2903142 RepID=UPI001E569AB3|nr:sigma-70 family RNA polymerase sigma factor [Rhabdothermincola salaria]MCD9623632.1 sigma-70 family RNA polymerase sigma factor [Rhabdothermincola salaria]